MKSNWIWHWSFESDTGDLLSFLGPHFNGVMYFVKRHTTGFVHLWEKIRPLFYLQKSLLFIQFLAQFLISRLSPLLYHCSVRRTKGKKCFFVEFGNLKSYLVSMQHSKCPIINHHISICHVLQIPKMQQLFIIWSTIILFCDIIYLLFNLILSFSLFLFHWKRTNCDDTASNVFRDDNENLRHLEWSKHI